MGLLAFGATVAGLDAALWFLVAIALSSASRALGGPSLDLFLPSRPSWSLVLRPCTPDTRRIVVAATDRVRLAPHLPLVTLAALGVALFALAAGRGGLLVGAAGLVGVVALAAWLGRPARIDSEGPEAAAARGLLRFAEQDDQSTAVVLAGGASARGHGIIAVLDWWGISPEKVEVFLVQPERATSAAGLIRAGWRVRSLAPEDLIEALRSSP